MRVVGAAGSEMGEAAGSVEADGGIVGGIDLQREAGAAPFPRQQKQMLHELQGAPLAAMSGIYEHCQDIGGRVRDTAREEISVRHFGGADGEKKVVRLGEQLFRLGTAEDRIIPRGGKSCESQHAHV